MQLIAGRYAAALDSVERALDLNPMAPPMYLVQRARTLYALDRFEASIGALQALPGSRLAMITAAAAGVALGNVPAARRYISDLLAQALALRLSAPMLAPYFARDPQRRQTWLLRLREAGMPTDAKSRCSGPNPCSVLSGPYVWSACRRGADLH